MKKRPTETRPDAGVELPHLPRGSAGAHGDRDRDSLWSSASGRLDLADGTTVAYATAGSGPPLLFVGGWLSHLELSWALPAERAFLAALARGRTLVRYDRPGCGLSGDASAPTMDREIETLSAVLAAIEAH